MLLKMERDFMGLCMAKAKEEDELASAARVRNTETQWTFCNKNPTTSPQIISFHGVPRGENPKTGFGSLASNGLVSITTSNGVGVVGKTTTSLRSPKANNSVAPAAAQLTIFYNGSVCAYDNISPEKARAVMLLAGNGAKNSTPAARSSSHNNNNAIIRRTAVEEGMLVFENGTNATMRSPRPAIGSIWVAGRPDGSADGSADGVPQFRKKSLARFLEKRKERVISSSPYGNNNKQ